MNDFNEKLNGATENHSAAFSGWVNKLKFDKSFTAKLILADNAVKEYYSDIATEILKYNKIKSRTGWSGVTFTAGRDRFASVAFVGKTLCLYLAADPDEIGGGKYKAKNVEEIKKRAKTPAMLKIKSDGGKRYALKVISAVAENFGLELKSEPIAPVNPFNFKSDTFNNLITRGLIRIVRGGNRASESDLKQSDEIDGFNETSPRGDVIINEAKRGVYNDTASTIEELLSRHGVYNDIAIALSEGNCKVEFSEKLMLRSVDEIWVRAIEDCVNSLDELIRNPNHFIAETEEVLPIELTKKVTGRSVAHLCRHTDYIKADERGGITPVKMLNVFREDSVLTYENKFLNTLIKKLYLFVGKRYDVLKERGADEKTTSLDYENSFHVGEGKAKIRISVEYSEREDCKNAKKVLAGSGLLSRVEKIHSIVSGYMNSSFVKEMGVNYIRPPVMRTNAIIKNKYFRECLALWEFIESYDDAGYGVTVEETNREISPDTAKRLYENAAVLYYLFRRGINEDYGETESYGYSVIPETYSPASVLPDKHVEKFEKEGETEYDSDDLDFAVLVALAADERALEKTHKPVKSFAERLCFSDETTKRAFAAVCNSVLKYKGVKLRCSSRYATLRRGRIPLIRITFGGKSLKAYFALEVSKIPEKYRAKDASYVKTYADTPSFIKLKSERSVKYALNMTEILAKEYSLIPSKKREIEIRAEDLSCENLKTDGIFQGKAFVFEKITNVLRENEELSGEISFGTQKNEFVEKTFKNAEKSAVKESGKIYKEVTLSETTESGENDIKTDLLEGITRIDNNYTVPTEFGLDDSKSFISYENENPIPDGLNRRNTLFGKRRGKR